MAGEWLKMRHDLADDPAVIRLADMVQLDDDAVIGKLFRLWSWADRHTHDGHADGIGISWVDRLAKCHGFGAALVRVGWLAETGEGLSFPRFDRHCSDTAKTRALDAKRKSASRSCPDSVRNLSGSQPDRNRTREEEEKRREELPPLPREGFDKTAWQTLRKAWNAGKGKAWKPVNPHPKAVERLSEPEWLGEALKAIERLGRCKFFRTAVSLGQFCGPDFVTLCNGGEYDDRNEDRKSKDFADAPAPPKEWTGEAAEALARTRRKLESSKEALA
jgi:hypothetical protein